MAKNSPVRLHKIEEKDAKSFLKKENTIIIANWVLMAILMILVVVFCFIVKGPTYGYL